MIDWLKKVGAAVGEAGSALWEAEAFVVEVNALTPEAALARLEAHVAGLDDTRFQMLVNRLAQEAQAAYQAAQPQDDSDAWGTSFEDRMAYLQARISSGESGRARAPSPERMARGHAFAALAGHAFLVRHAARGGAGGPAVFSCDACGRQGRVTCDGNGQHLAMPSVVRLPQGAGCLACGQPLQGVGCECGRLVPLARVLAAAAPAVARAPPAPSPPPSSSSAPAAPARAAQPAPASTPPLDHEAFLRRYTDLQRRSQEASRFLMSASVPEPRELAAVEAVLAEARAFAREWRHLPPELVDPIRFVEADVAHTLARGLARAGDRAQAAARYEEAARAFEALGRPEKAEEVRRVAGLDRLLEDGTVDEAMLAAHRAIDETGKLPQGADAAVLLAYAQPRVDLADALVRGGDRAGARPWLDEAEARLREAKARLGDVQLVTKEEMEAYIARPPADADLDALQARALALQVHSQLVRVAMLRGEAPSGPPAGGPEQALKARLDGLREPARDPDASARVEDILGKLQVAEKEARDARLPEGVAVALLRRGETLLAAGRPREAVPVLAEARASLAGRRKGDLEPAVLGHLARAHAALGDWRLASTVCQQGIDLVEAQRWKTSAPYVQGAYLRDHVSLYALAVRAAFELGDDALTLARADLAKARALARPRAGAPTPEAARLKAQLAEASAQVDAAQAAGDEAREREALARRAALWDRYAIARAGDAPPREGPALRDLQAALEPDEAVLDYFWIERDLLLVAAFDRARVAKALVRLAPEARAALDDFAAYAFGAKMEQQTRAALGAKLRALPAAHLLPEAVRAVLKDKARLVVSPHRVLHAVPFHALRWEATEDEEVLLVDRFALTYAPNLASLLAAYDPPAARGVLSLGVGTFDAALKERHKMGDLPTVAAEVDALRAECRRRDVPFLPLREGDATEGLLRKMAGDGTLRAYPILHVGTHGASVVSEAPLESFLLLQGSRLDGLEIASWDLDADLVLLTACNAGQRSLGGRGLDELPGDDLLGLPAAFLAAGARRILCGLWTVESGAAGPFMAALVPRILDGETPERAVQAAMRQVRSDPALRAPFYWAPFILIAAGRPRRAGPAGAKPKTETGR